MLYSCLCKRAFSQNSNNPQYIDIIWNIWRIFWIVYFWIMNFTMNLWRNQILFSDLTTFILHCFMHRYFSLLKKYILRALNIWFTCKICFHGNSPCRFTTKMFLVSHNLDTLDWILFFYEWKYNFKIFKLILQK